MRLVATKVRTVPRLLVDLLSGDAGRRPMEPARHTPNSDRRYAALQSFT